MNKLNSLLLSILFAVLATACQDNDPLTIDISNRIPDVEIESVSPSEIVITKKSGEWNLSDRIMCFDSSNNFVGWYSEERDIPTSIGNKTIYSIDSPLKAGEYYVVIRFYTDSFFTESELEELRKLMKIEEGINNYVYLEKRFPFTISESSSSNP